MMPWIIAGTPGRLDLAAGQDQRPEQDRRDDDPERPEPGEVGDDDRGEAVARRDVVLEPVDDAGDLAHPAEPGQRPGDDEDDDDLAADVDAGVARGPRVVADEPDLVAPAGPLEGRPT